MNKTRKKTAFCFSALVITVFAVILLVCFFFNWSVVQGREVAELFEPYTAYDWSVNVHTVNTDKVYICSSTQNAEHRDRLIDMFGVSTFYNVLNKSRVAESIHDPELPVWLEITVKDSDNTILLRAKEISIDGKSYFWIETNGETTVLRIGSWKSTSEWTHRMVAFEYYGTPVDG